MNSERFVQKLTMRPVPAVYADIYRARGIEVPLSATPHSVGALIPLPLRAVHELWAKTHGYYWLPCILCGRMYGGHEITAVTPDPTRGEGGGQTICPFCTIERNSEDL